MRLPKSAKRFLARHRITQESFFRKVYYPIVWKLGRRGDLPTVLIVGAQKAGTTTLHRMLNLHPKVHQGLFKESHFFDKPDNFNRGEGYYRAIFPKVADGEHLLDSSPMMYHEAIPKVASELLPDAKIVMILRDPVARAFSHYRHNVARQSEELSFEEALEAEGARIEHTRDDLFSENSRSSMYRAYSYMERGRYDEQIMRWLEFYDRSQVKIFVFEEFVKDPQNVVDEIFEWLGLDHFRLPESALRPRNEAVIPGTISKETEAKLRKEFAGSVSNLEGLLCRELPWKRST